MQKDLKNEYITKAGQERLKEKSKGKFLSELNTNALKEFLRNELC